jgi:hypothetical protein
MTITFDDGLGYCVTNFNGLRCSRYFETEAEASDALHRFRTGTW